jgi:alkylation response protein AidB-like acyl-CoA dehydrogenase
VEVDAARWLMYRAAWDVDGGAPGSSAAAMASLVCTEALSQATSKCMRVYGGYGLTMEFDIQRHFRDAQSFVAENGARQIRRNRVGHTMGLGR